MRKRSTEQEKVPEVTFLQKQIQKKKEKSSNVLTKTIEIVRKSREYKKANEMKLVDFEINSKDVAENLTCPLYRQYSPDDFMIARFDSRCHQKITQEILEKGVDVRYEGKPEILERYTFFAHSASQLRQRVCVLYNCAKLGPADKIITEFGDFSKLKTVAKRAARIGLLLSTAGDTVWLDEKDVSRIDDVERDNYTFTDGCGYISVSLAEKVTEHLGIIEKYRHQKYPLPSVFQVRLLGCKGVLSIKPTLENGVEIRKSMEKFTWSLPGSFPLGVVDKGYSRPYEVASLNKQFILLLSALGISDEVFLEKQKAYFQDMISLTHNKETAFTYLCAFGEISIAERLLETDDFDKVVLAKIKSIQQRVYGSSKHKTGDKNKKSPAERLKIPVEKSRNVYGISDPSEGGLEYGTCFFQPTIRGNATVIDGKVVVAKNPCYSPGDIRILTCVDVPCCHHLVDCIVFPTEGERPHPDEIAGSDLDGDKFFVCWDSELIPCKSENPVSYPAAKVRPMNCIKQKDMIEYFARYSNATIGKVDSLFSKWADREGVGSVECQMLSALFSRVIDSAKTGERVIIPKHLQISSGAPPHKEKFVWHKMALRANLFLEDRASNAKRGYQVQLTEDTVRSILSNEIISVSEYQLFRFLYKWAKQEKVSAQRLCAIAEEYIDFTQFSPQQRQLAPIDFIGLNQDLLHNPFTRSEILSEYDRKNLVSDFGDIPRRYSMVFKSDAEDLSWNVLNNVLTSALAKILIFKFLLGNMKWVFVLNLPQKLASREALEVNEAEDSLIPRAYLSIHQDNPVSKRFLLKGGYSISLDDERLQIYQGGTKTKTFISFMVNDANDLSIVSIDLDRIDRGLAKKYGVRLRKEAFVSLEVYCHDPTGAPIPKIHRVGQQTAEEPLSSSQEASVSDYRSTDGDFPDLGEEYGGIHLETEKELSKLRDLQQSGNLETKKFHQIRDLLVHMKDCPMERHEWSCKLESLLDECAISFGNPDDYVRLLLYLLDGLKKRNLSTLIGNRVNITLLGRIRRVLENMERNNILFSVENVFELLETLLFVHDWHTSVFVVKLFKLGCFPIAETQFLPHANTVGYFVHWVSLLYLEILEEIREQEGEDMSYKGNPLVFQGNAFRETSEGDKSKSSECTIFVQQGEATCSPGDFLALSPTNARHVLCERKYIVEVKSIAGKLMSVEVVWPKQECVIDDVIEHAWKIVPFPNLVSCNRMLDSLRKLCTATSLEDVGVFSKLLSTWAVIPQKGDGSERLTDELSQELSYLNPSQRLAVQQACCNKPGLTLIQGPPGTGKSKTSASIIQKLLAQDPNGKILAVAETNEGVDNLLEKIVDVAKSIPELELLRLGSSTWTVRENLKKYTLASRYKKRSGGKLVKEDRMDSKFVKKILKEARVVCTTCISAGSKILEKMQFSRLLVDEASQATEPAILVPISKGCKVLVLVGDDKQLPPTVKCKAAKELSETSFSRMRLAGEPVYLLDTQYRMHPAIAEFPSKVFYNDELKDGVKEQDRPAPQGFCWPKAGRPVAFVEMTDNAKEEGGRSKKNTKEAAVVKQIITNLLRQRDLQPAEIGVVTPYKAQVKLLSDEIRNHPEVSVRTVDGFQGQEREVIVFSAVRCNDVGHLGFLDDDQRMNVLLTRAKRGLIVIGNKKTLVESDKNSTWNKWVKWIEEEKLTVDSAQFLPDSHISDSGQSRGQSHGRGRGQRREATRGTRGSGRRGGRRGRGK